LHGLADHQLVFTRAAGARLPMWHSRAGACLILLACGVAAQVQQNPAFCASDVVNAVNQLAAAANDLAQTAVDCTVPTLDESSCAIDITRWISHFTKLAARIARATVHCGNLDNTCAANVATTFTAITNAASALIAAAGDCLVSPFLCTFDVFVIVDEMSNFARLLLADIRACNQKGIAPAAPALLAPRSATASDDDDDDYDDGLAPGQPHDIMADNDDGLAPGQPDEVMADMDWGDRRLAGSLDDGEHGRRTETEARLEADVQAVERAMIQWRRRTESHLSAAKHSPLTSAESKGKLELLV